MTLNPITAVIALFAIGLAIRVALRLAYGVRGAAPGDPVSLSLGVLSWIILAAGIAAFVAASFFMALVPFFICAFAFLEMLLARRTQQRQEAWSIITRATAVDRPVEPALRESLGRFHGPVRRAARQFLNELAEGTPLATAVGNHPQAFPPQAQALAALAESGGLSISTTTREETLSREGASIAGGVELWRLSRRFSYLFGLVLMMIAILTFIMIAIVPAFEAIFNDFGLELPIMTLFLLETASLFYASHLGLLFYAFVLLLGAGSLLAMVCYIFDTPILKGVIDRIFYVWRRADLLRLLATVIDHQMPLLDAVGRLAYGEPRYPSRWIATRLRRCYEAMNQGGDWRDAMRKSKLLTAADAELLRSAEGAGNISWALRSIADRQVARAEFRWEAGQQIAFTIAILLFGLFVGWVCLGMFLPLVKLIQGLT